MEDNVKDFGSDPMVRGLATALESVYRGWRGSEGFKA